MSNLVRTMRFWNKLHQNLKIGKPNILKFREQ